MSTEIQLLLAASLFAAVLIAVFKFTDESSEDDRYI